MSSEKQIAANRLNSQKSTGPRTEAGKLTSRMNALQSGIHAESHVIRGEDPDALAQLTAEYNAEFHPVTPCQRDLVDTLVHNQWQIRRLRAIEAELWAAEFDEKDHFTVDPKNHYDVRRRQFPLRSAYQGQEMQLERLQRRIHACERSTARALKQLQELQKSTTSDQIGFVPSPSVEQPFQVAMPAFEPAYSGSTVPPAQCPIGFVPSIPPQPLIPGPEPLIPNPEPLIPAERSEALLR
jgi:hypothetical protein